MVEVRATSSNDELQRLRERLADQGEKVQAYFRSLPAESWTQQIYITGSIWTVWHVLAHFCSTERTFVHYVRDFMHGGSGAPPHLDIDAFNEAEVASLQGTSAQDLLSDFARRRTNLIELTKAMSPHELDRTANHPWFGETPLRTILRLVYQHNLLHLRDIRRALAMRSPVRHNERGTTRSPSDD